MGKESENKTIHPTKIYYDAVRRSYEELNVLFPFPHGGLPREEEVRAQAVKLLRQVKEDESEAVEVLRELLTELRFSYSAQGLSPVHHISLNPFYSFGGNQLKPASSQFSTATLEGVVCMCGNLRVCHSCRLKAFYRKRKRGIRQKQRLIESMPGSRKRMCERMTSYHQLVAVHVLRNEEVGERSALVQKIDDGPFLLDCVFIC